MRFTIGEVCTGNFPNYVRDLQHCLPKMSHKNHQIDPSAHKSYSCEFDVYIDAENDNSRQRRTISLTIL